MVIRNFAKYLAPALLAVACTAKETVESQAPSTSEPVVSSPYVPGTAIVEFDEDLTALVEAGEATKAPGLADLMADLGIAAMERVFPDAGEFEPRTRAMGLHRFYTVTFSDDVPVTKAVGDIASVPGVVSVSPSLPVRKRAVFNDPRLSSQWHYISSNGADINVQGVWEQYTTGNPKVVVCVVDEPIDAIHEDLKANLWDDGSGHTGYNYARSSYDLSIRPENGNGDIGHGTHVAGTISAVNNNGKGVCGIAGGNAAAGIGGVRLMSHAIFSGSRSASDANTARALKEGADKGAVISQNSWGLYADGILDGNQDGRVSTQELNYLKSLDIDSYPALKQAIDYFIKYAGCDNDGNQLPDSPMKGGLVLFAAGNEGDQNVDWDPYAAYEPVIAVGATNASAGRAYYSNYGSWVDIAAPGGDDNHPIWSTLPTKILSAGYAGYEDGYPWLGTSMACPHVSGVAALIISYFGGPGFTADNCRDILFKGLGSTIGGSKPIGKKLDALASFQYGVQHYPVGGGSSSGNEPPVIKLEMERVTVKAHESVTVNFSAYDPNGDDLTISCSTGSKALTMDQKGLTLLIEGWKAPAGTYEATVSASDGKAVSQAVLTYTILENHAPEVKGSVNNVLLTGLQYVGNVDLTGLFHDPDGEQLHYRADVSEAPCVTAQVTGEKLSLLPAKYGRGSVRLVAEDALGKTAEITFLVAVADPSNPVTLYPTQVIDNLYITLETEYPTPVHVSLYTSTGALVEQLDTVGSVFDPINLDVTDLVPGRYTAILSYLESEHKLQFIKY